MILALVASALAFAPSLHAQVPVSVMRGQVVDGATSRPVPSAAVSLRAGEQQFNTVTDSAGLFLLNDIPVGPYALHVERTGYDPLIIPELWLRAGKEVVQRVELFASSNTLAAVTIDPMGKEHPAVLGIQPFTVEQGLRFPATFQDPARLVTAFPGVAQANDQSNHLIIRGNSPNANAWVLEGVEIVSPNHLTNAGTPSDLPTLSGGGVNILSAQMLGPSQLLTGVLPMEQGDALGGIMDMHLRKGNSQQQEWTAQAGLLGLDLATEGPLGKGGRSSYLVNYRYSTVGLLSAMGVDLGDEAITFQDLSFHVAVPVGKRGELRLFGLGGSSSNIFEAERDTAAWEFDKDGQDITYTSRTGAVGASIRLPLHGSTSWKIAIAYSQVDQDREAAYLLNDLTSMPATRMEIGERKLSAATEVNGSIGGRFRYGIGASVMERYMDSYLDHELSGWLLRPWLSGRWSFSDRVQATVGIGYSHFTFNGDHAVEPRAALEWNMPGQHRLALSYGIRSQLPYWQVMDVQYRNADIGLSRSQDVVLGYDHPFTERLKVHVEVYHQILRDVAVADQRRHLPNFSMVNVWDEPVLFDLEATGTATNNGVELSVDHHFANGFFYQVNTSLFNSTYESETGEWYNTRWNSNCLFNLLGGKEWSKTKEDRVRTWGVSGRLNAMGGQRIPSNVYSPVPNLSHTDEPFSEQLAPYYRLDVRVYLKKDRKGRTGMWSVDIQNATNAQNEAYRYYDVRKGEVVTKYQLGIIPNLSYRIEF